MRKVFEERIKKETVIRNIDIFFLVDDYLQMKCNLYDNKMNKKFCFYVYKVGILEAVSKSKYTKLDTNQVELNSGGNYWVKAFVKDDETNEIVTKISDSIQKTKIIEV